ncbi:uncharacterized protein LOC143585829 [Bidens hawaiensis]|uniref:uncharacterized protein LOC143585829 n=1 Tax=Bidens hawaiensis TaxID=980011 RepID=UPI00404B3716
MESDSFFIYKTTSPLTITVARPTAQQPEPEPYYVLRNICTNSTPLPESSAPEFYSLDGDEDTDDRRIKRPRLANEEPNSCLFKSPMLRLHKEILDFCDFLSPTVEEQVSRNTAVETVSNVIKSIWPNCKVEIFGSFKTGLFLPTSNVDMVILESHIHPETGLRTLSRTLHRRGLAISIQVFGKARVPIIKFVEKRSGISFDISFNMDHGPKASEYIQDAISKWPPLRPLCLVLKIFLLQRRLNEVHSGGIGSFALLAMLIAMLRNSVNKHSFSQYNLGVLLVTFFDMYGCKLNTLDVGVSCNEGGAFFPKSSKGFLIPGKSLLLSIQNPLDPEKDVGKNSHKYIKIKCAFRMACSILTNTQLIMSLGPDRSILGTIIGPDEVLLERKGGLNGDVAFTDVLPGAGELMVDEFCGPYGLFAKQHIDDCKEPLPPCEKEVAGGDDGVGEKAEESSKKVVKVKKVKVKKMKKVAVIKEKNTTSTDADADANTNAQS